MDNLENTEEAVEEAVAVEEPVEDITPVKNSAPASAPNAVVGTGDADNVYLSKCVYKNMYAKKSLTVHHLQRRLTELGYTEADADKDGWYGDGTARAVRALQEYLGIESDSGMNAETFEAVFAGDPNVQVVID